jgi:hypothetical protein
MTAMGTKSREVIWGGAVMGAKSRAQHAREEAQRAAREAGSLDQCITAFMSTDGSQRHLYEIHTIPQPPLVTEVLQSEHVIELSRLRNYLR